MITSWYGSTARALELEAPHEVVLLGLRKVGSVPVRSDKPLLDGVRLVVEASDRCPGFLGSQLAVDLRPLLLKK
jgi:hypothetical protein